MAKLTLETSVQELDSILYTMAKIKSIQDDTILRDIDKDNVEKITGWFEKLLAQAANASR